MPVLEEKSSSKTQIIVALLGLIGVVVVGLFTNWDKIFPSKGSVIEEWKYKLEDLRRRAALHPPPSSPDIQVSITFPQNRSDIKEFITMKGTVAGNVGNAHLWVVCKEEDNSIYFPQNEEIHPINGNWSLPRVRVGAGDMGKDVPYELKVIQPNDIMDEAFRLYFRIGQYNNEWIGFSDRSGIRELAKVTVVRR